MSAGRHGKRSAPSTLAVLVAAALAVSALPLAGIFAQEPSSLADACPVEPPPSGFADRNDIPAAHVLNVDCAVFLQIVNGFPDNTFRSQQAVRRDQMASFIALALEAAGVGLPAADAEQFTDVPDASPHRVHINRLAVAGIIRGGPLHLPPTAYGPELGTRRDQMASLLMRAAGYAFYDDPDAFVGDLDGPGDARFSDVTPRNVHYGNVNAAAHSGLSQGYPDGRYRPADATTRGQMASFVVRLLRFLAVAHEVRITEQSAETATVGQTITVTATVFDQFGNPSPQTTTVTFSATTTPPETATVATNAQSRAGFAFTSTVPETVTVTAAIPGPGGNFLNADGDSHSVQKRFVGAAPPPPPPPAGVVDTLELQPETATNVVGTAHTMTVTARLGAQPVAGAQVRVDIVRGEQVVETRTVTTGPDGTAGFVYTGPQEAAEDTIWACTTPEATLPPACAGAGVGVAFPVPTDGLAFADLDGPTTAQDLAEAVGGPGVSVSDVSYTGAGGAAALFAGGGDILGLEQGVVLSTGRALDAEGPNEVPDRTTSWQLPGDERLAAIAGTGTFDAAVLEFNFVPTSDRLRFEFVFGSEEYNEFVGSEFNDVFALWINDVNCALTPEGDPVTVNTINAGQPGVAPTNPQLYRNNDPFDPNAAGQTVPPAGVADTEMDGFTVVLACDVAVAAGQTNTARFAIADAADGQWDSWVFVGTLAAMVFDTATKSWIDDPAPPPPPPPPPTAVETLELAPETATNLVATPHTMTVTARFGQQPVAGAQVLVEVVRGDAVVETQTVTTGSDGTAPFSYTGPAEPAEDTIWACTTPQGNLPESCAGAGVGVGFPVPTDGLAFADLEGPTTPQDLAEAVGGPGVSVSNVAYTGEEGAAALFAGGGGIIGLDQGVVLSSGRAAAAQGPNQSSSTGTAWGSPGDPELQVIAGAQTFDAAVLEFDFVPAADRVRFDFVFGSDEYNEFVGSGFNDVFALWINDVNCALTPAGDPVTINTINNGRPNVEPSNPQLYRNNDPFAPDATEQTVPSEQVRNTEMDGFTVVLSCDVTVATGQTNTARFAIADAGDSGYDSWVFVGSLAAIVFDTATKSWVGPADGEGETATAGVAVTPAAHTSEGNRSGVLPGLAAAAMLLSLLLMLLLGLPPRRLTRRR